MNETNEYVTDPLAVQVINYLASKNQIDASQWLAPSGITAVSQAVANVQARADQKRREAAEAEVAKVLETRSTAEILGYYLSGGSDTEPTAEPVPLNSALVAAELQRLLDGD